LVKSTFKTTRATVDPAVNGYLAGQQKAIMLRMKAASALRRRAVEMPQGAELVLE